MSTIKQQIEQKQKRLDAYYAKEIEMLSGGAQAYGIGPRSITKYPLSLPEIRKAIETLESEIKQLKKKLGGGSRRKAQRFVPRGW